MKLDVHRRIVMWGIVACLLLAGTAHAKYVEEWISGTSAGIAKTVPKAKSPAPAASVQRANHEAAEPVMNPRREVQKAITPKTMAATPAPKAPPLLKAPHAICDIPQCAKGDPCCRKPAH